MMAQGDVVNRVDTTTEQYKPSATAQVEFKDVAQRTFLDGVFQLRLQEDGQRLKFGHHFGNLCFIVRVVSVL